MSAGFRHPAGRVFARDKGLLAERLVADYLKARGYALVAQNLRLGYLEIDLVARKNDLVVVVEVRTRGQHSRTTGFGSIGRIKRQRLRRAGERLWQRRYRHDPSVARLRFDAAQVTFDREGRPRIEYVPAAF